MLTEGLDRAGAQRPHAGRGEAHDLADLGVVELAPIAQEQDFALALRQGPGEGVEPEPELAVGGRGVRGEIAPADRQRQPLDESPAAPAVEGLASGDRQQPRQRATGRTATVAPRLEGAPEGVGGEVLRIVRPPEEEGQLADDAALVVAIDLLERGGRDGVGRARSDHTWYDTRATHSVPLAPAFVSGVRWPSSARPAGCAAATSPRSRRPARGPARSRPAASRRRRSGRAGRRRGSSRRSG